MSESRKFSCFPGDNTPQNSCFQLRHLHGQIKVSATFNFYLCLNIFIQNSTYDAVEV